MNKRGDDLLLENIIFIILIMIFLAILVTFIVTKSGSAAVLEQKYAKEIALVLDSARPGMVITINMVDAISVAQKNLGKNNINNIVTISGNIVTVKLRDPGGYSYSFFNNITFDGQTSNYYLDKPNNDYVFFIGNYNG